MAGSDLLPLDSLSNFGLDLSGHHPVSFPYHTALPNDELASSPPPDLVYGATDEVHCVTCHDPHTDKWGKFLLKDNRYSALCTRCHLITGWSGSAHATSTASVVGVLPRPPKTWPTYTQLNFAPTAEELLNFTTAPPDPFSCTSAGCHNSEPAPQPHSGTASGSGAALVARAPTRMVDIARQVRKPSAHHEAPGNISTVLRKSRAAGGSIIRSVACADCHNPHLVGAGIAEAPYASPMLRGVSGVDRNGVSIGSARYEYEVCFKCHGENAPDLNYVPRVLSVTNTRLAFDPTNPSYHPVVSMGKHLNIPSIPSSLNPTLSVSSMIYCSTCHCDDEGGSRGPHGSSFAPILKERYETADGTPESYDNYALCYRCHERTSILRDVSFRKKILRKTPSGGGHSGHLAAGAPCSACHDPHGVNDSGAVGPTGTGSHTHLINFDTRIVSPKTGAQYPVFTETGTFSGTCTLTCHGVVHDNTSYP
jgi:predicted CXXCH cytochrome family protein